MRKLNVDEYALLELTVVQPVAYLPARHLKVARTLETAGLLRLHDGYWLPTLSGLARAGHRLH